MSAHAVESDLGNDQLWEALTRLPAKEVIRFVSSLSKTAHSLLSEPFFLENQSVRSSRYDGGFLLQPETSWKRYGEPELVALPEKTPTPTFGVPRESLPFLGRVLASCQGLVLSHKAGSHDDDGGEFLISNPATRRWAPLPAPGWVKSIRDNGLLLECHPTRNPDVDFTDDYTVIAPVVVEEDDNPWGWSYHLAVYRNGRWEPETCDLKIKGWEACLDRPVGVFRETERCIIVHYLYTSLPNALRTPCYLEPYIAAFDMQRKALSATFQLPKGAWKEQDDNCIPLRMFKWRDTIGVLRVDNEDGCTVTVWVLEDYEGRVWREVLRKTTVEIGVPEEAMNSNGMLRCYVVNSRSLVLVTERRVYAYEMEGEDAGKLEVVADNGWSCPWELKFLGYANTLRPVSTGPDTRIATF